MKLSEFCTRDVAYIEPEASLLEVAQLMRRKHVGNVVIAEEHADRRVPIGIVTDRDLAIGIIAEGLDPASISARDLVLPDALLTGYSDEDLSDALDRMRARGVRRLPVIERNGALAGILSLDDVLELMSEQLSGIVSLLGRQRRRENAVRRAYPDERRQANP